MRRIVRKVARRTRALVHATRWQLRPIFHPRRFHAFCVGALKSGTHSMAGLFSHYRAAHEPEYPLLIDTALEARAGRLNRRAQVAFVKQRDFRLWLELDSSALNIFFLDILVREFPRARFILTIRDCYSWLDSIINHHLTWTPDAHWRKNRDLAFRPDTFSHPPQERLLAEKGLYTLDGYLAYWAGHNQRVLATVPRERLLIVKTQQITGSVEPIATFLGVPPDSLNPAQSHLFKADQKFHILPQLDPAYLEHKVATHCRALMEAYFPQIRSLTAALG